MSGLRSMQHLGSSTGVPVGDQEGAKIARTVRAESSKVVWKR